MIANKKNKKKMVPELRFGEFDSNGKENNIEKYSFEDVFVFSTGKNIKQREASPEFEIPCVRYGELYHMYNEVIYNVINKTNLDRNELVFSKGTEILLPSAGEDPLDIGSASALTIENVAIGRTINILRPKVEGLYSQIFASYYINQQLKIKIATLARGASISNVYNSDLRKLNIVLPSLSEQKKIATFLSTIDKKIQQLTRKKELLEAYKKGLMQQLFSGELRFKPDRPRPLSEAEGEGKEYPAWEEKRLGEVCDSIKSGKSSSSEDGPFPLFGSTGIIGLCQDYSHEGTFILIARVGANAGKMNLVEGRFGVSDNTLVVTCSEEIDKIYIYNYLFYYNLNRLIFGSGQPLITGGLLKKLKLRLPCLIEQKKIANLLSNFDSKIEFVETQITKTQTFKKGLLQKMFV